jgi:prolyl-tRNA editing enzyme YbaK/EbsC (Cys-tRNA(Pro) deacylase)
MEAVRSVLDKLDVAYEIVLCDPQFADTAEFCRQYGYLSEQCANTIVVASKREPKTYAAGVVLATTRLDINKTMCRLMQVPKASFASANETQQLTGMLIGGVTIFALPDDLTIYVDQHVMQQPWVIVGGGDRSSKIKISPGVFLHMKNVEIIAGLSLPSK